MKKDKYFNNADTVLFRPYVQGVLWMMPHVQLNRCSDTDIIDD